MRRPGAALLALLAEANIRNTALVFVSAYPIRSDEPTTYTEADPGDAQVYARFKLRAIPYLRSGSFPNPLTIRYQVSQEGDFVAASELGEKNATVTPTINAADIPITADNVNEADGKITLKVLPGSNYLIAGHSNPASGIVRDDDTPGVSFGGTTLAVVEGTDDPAQAVLRVEPPSYQDITVRLWTQEPHQGRWSATEGQDYDYASSGATYIDVPISAGTQNVTVEVNRDTTTGVQIMDDADVEDYEHFYLKITRGREGYEVSGRDWLRVTIIDDENPPPMPEANGDGTYTVPMDWPLVPEELRKTGGEFRLLFLTNSWRDATTSNITNYDAHVQASIAGSHTGGSHPAIIPYSDAFKVVGSTPTVNARDHIDAGRDAPIYWLNGPRVARDNTTFWSNSWEHWAAHERRTAASVPRLRYCSIRAQISAPGLKSMRRPYTGQHATRTRRCLSCCLTEVRISAPGTRTTPRLYTGRRSATQIRPHSRCCWTTVPTPHSVPTPAGCPVIMLESVQSSRVQMRTGGSRPRCFKARQKGKTEIIYSTEHFQ